MASENPSPRDVIVGELKREYTLTANQEWILDTPGGSALYASGGYLVWEKESPPGLSARVGEDYPQRWLKDLGEQNIDTRGVVILPHPLDLRICVIQEGINVQETSNPLPHLTRLDVNLPPGLVGLKNESPQLSSRSGRKETSILASDIPAAYLAATGVHLCPLDFLSHNLLPAVFRQQGYTTITLDPGESYLDPAFFSDLPALVMGLTAFFPSEEGLRNLYKGISTDVWEMVSDLGHYGCEFLIVKRGAGGQSLYVSATEERWDIPAYPARIRNPFRAGDAFCGGFLVGYRRTFDPKEAVCYGNVAASLAVEGRGPFYPLQALPGLAEARLEVVREMARRV